MPRPHVVATAAPVTPRRGKGPSPKMKHGSRKRLKMLASQSDRIAIDASPEPRKIALIRNRSRMTPLAPSMIAVKREPVAMTPGAAPIAASRRGASVAPAMPMGTATAIPSAIDWTAAAAARSGSFSPMRRATVAMAPIDSPIATA